MDLLAYAVVFGHTTAAVLLGWAYFSRYQITRPPIGVITCGDIAVVIGGIVLVPYLYLVLPSGIVVAILALGMLGILYAAGEPLFSHRWMPCLAVLGLLSADIGLALAIGTTSPAFLAVNNLVLVGAVIAVTNLWAQSGMRARDAAVLGGVLTVYDFVATSLLPLTTDLIIRLAGLPFSPVVAWRTGDAGGWLGIGLGDLLLATTFPLVARKAFGRPAGLVALAVSLAVTAVLLLLAASGALGGAFPVMVVLGPLMVGQYAYWIRRQGSERTTGQYLREEQGEVLAPELTMPMA